MSISRLGSICIAAVVGGLAACDSASDPTAVPQQPAVAASRAKVVPPDYLVTFKAQMPAAFEARVKALGGTVNRKDDALGFASVRGLDAQEAQSLVGDGLAQSAEVEPVFSVVPKQKVLRRAALKAKVNSPTDPTLAAIFADLQWNMVAIHAPEAWAAGKLGSSSVEVGILDTGIDYTYPDLAGLVDLDRSIDLVGETDSIVKYIGTGRHPITDLNGHGSNVAGIVSSNALISAGVTSQTRLLGVKVCTMRGSCPISAVLEGIRYAADAGVAVINLSEGILVTHADLQGSESLLNRATDYAHRKNVLIIVSAGNDATNLDGGGLFALHCDDANVVCVSATGPTGLGAFGPFVNVDAFAPYSNFGRSAINVAAPGGNLVLGPGGALVDLTPVWGVCSLTSLAFANFPPAPDEPPTGLFCPELSIGGFVGTSQAAPHVTGLAAALAATGLSKPSQLRAAIQRGADDLGARGTDPLYGKGRINVAASLGVD
jgi:lantibiotic leader peptide-processing serine protease